jgi:hypothetical protein
LYRYSSLSEALFGLARNFINLLTPFAKLVALRSLTIWQGALLLLELATIALIALWTKTTRAWMMASGWVFLTILPPSMFAHAVNSERYMFLPMLGVAFAIALTVDTMIRRRPQVAPLFTLVLIVYSVACIPQLAAVRNQWGEAGQSIQLFISSIRLLAPPAEARSLSFVNLPQFHGQVPVLNNALRGALLSIGYPDRVTLLANYVAEPTEPSYLQSSFVQKLLACPVSTSIDSSHRNLLWIDNHLLDKTGSCADDAIKLDQQQRPDAWLHL